MLVQEHLVREYGQTLAKSTSRDVQVPRGGKGELMRAVEHSITIGSKVYVAMHLTIVHLTSHISQLTSYISQLTSYILLLEGIRRLRQHGKGG